MIERFKGVNNHSKLIEELKKQKIVSNNEILAEELNNELELIELEAEKEFISQHNEDDDLYLIIAGRVSVRVHGREVAIMQAGEHVGEMAVIDPTAKRSASVFTLERTVLGKISELAFSKLANKYPNLWRCLALKLGDRLRERNDLITQRNPRPVIFVGSSKESISIVRAIQNEFEHDDFIVCPWTKSGLFGASSFAIETLEGQVQSSDFAVLVLGPDDIVASRGEISDAPRDNVVFELGLFMGSLTHRRTFIVMPRNTDIKIPSDLLGLTPLEYAAGTSDTLQGRISPACNKLRDIIKDMGPK